MEKLDNLVWHCLQETHQDFGLDYGSLRCYHPDYCPFGGFIGQSDLTADLIKHAKMAGPFFVLGQKPQFLDQVKFLGEFPCVQMVIEKPIDHPITEEIIPLNGQYEDELLAFMQRFYPNFFKRKTMNLGDYFGIFKENELVAVTGERMQMHGYTEVSAVVTHSEHLGKGYAKQLVTHTVNNIFKKNEIPFLHTNADSEKNIGLYEKLGFKIRREISLWRFAEPRVPA